MNRHETECWTLDELGKKPAGYRPTFDFDRTSLDETHQSFASCPLHDNGMTINWDPEITGWLTRAEALKIMRWSIFQMAIY